MSKMTSDPNAKVTISDIARETGVSPATVSLVLRDKPGVGTETRRRVLDKAQALGYIYTPSAQSAGSTVQSLGLVIKAGPDDLPDANNFYTPVLGGIEAVCRKNQINLMFSNMPVDDLNHPIELPRLVTETEVDGLLLVGMDLDVSLTATIYQRGIPVVLVDAYAYGDPFDAVVSDNTAGAYRATRYLIDNGHRRIAIIGSQPEAYPSIRERRAGYLQAMTETDLPPVFLDCHLTPPVVADCFPPFLTEHPDVTAVFGCNDEVAIAVMQSARALGRRVPDELSVIGFDNILLAQHVTPPLSTMRIDKMGMGRLAAQSLLNRIEFPEAGQVRVVISPSLIERHSVRPL